jgi:hypothetical protein
MEGDGIGKVIGVDIEVENTGTAARPRNLTVYQYCNLSLRFTVLI